MAPGGRTPRAGLSPGGRTPRGLYVQDIRDVPEHHGDWQYEIYLRGMAGELPGQPVRLGRSSSARAAEAVDPGPAGLRLGRRRHGRHDAGEPRGVPPPAHRPAHAARRLGAGSAHDGARHRDAGARAARAGRRADDPPSRRRARLGARGRRGRAARRGQHRRGALARGGRAGGRRRAPLVPALLAQGRRDHEEPRPARRAGRLSARSS